MTTPNVQETYHLGVLNQQQVLLWNNSTTIEVIAMMSMTNVCDFVRSSDN
jgi:hypothetical protein